ncbi:unnamed protein product, partial [Musa textilis]
MFSSWQSRPPLNRWSSIANHVWSARLPRSLYIFCKISYARKHAHN